MDYRQVMAEIVVQILGFLLALWVLKIFAWKPLLKLLDERRSRIEGSFKEIDVKNIEVAKLREEYTRLIADIEDETRHRIQQAVEEGRKIAGEIQDKARQDARSIIEKAKQDISLELAKAKVELKGEIAHLALSAAEKLIRKELDEAAALKLTMDAIGEIDKMAR